MSFTIPWALIGQAASFLAAVDPDPTSKTLLVAGAAVAPEIPVIEGDVETLWADAKPALSAFKIALHTLDSNVTGGAVSDEHVQAVVQTAQAVVWHPSFRMVGRSAVSPPPT